MSKTTKWIIGIVLAVVLLQFAMPFVWQLLYPVTGAYGYGMPMMRGGGYGSPMMGGYGMHTGFGFFGGFFMVLFPLGLLALIVLGIVYLWKKINEKPVSSSPEQ